MEISIPKNIFEEAYEKAKLIKESIDKDWKICEEEKNESICEDIYENINDKRDSFLEKNLSMFLFIDMLDNVSSRKENEQYDVSKIVISPEDNKSFMEYDRKILKLFFGDMYTEDKINQEVSMLHLMSGFKVLENSPKDKIIIEENYIKKII